MITSYNPTEFQKKYSEAVYNRSRRTKEIMPILIELHKRLRIVYLSYFLFALGIFLLPEQFLYKNYTFSNYRPAIYKILYSILENSIRRIFDIENIEFIISSPFTVISASIQLAMMLSFVVNTPLILYHMYSFVEPGLYQQEKKIIKEGMFIIVGLFYLGATIAYLVIVPVTIQILTLTSIPLIGYGNEVPISVLFTLDSIFSIIVWTVFSAGLLYMLPGIIYLLVLMDVIDVDYLAKNRKNVIMAILTIAAVITPDPTMVSMLIISGPVIVIYEFIIHMGYNNKRKFITNDYEWRLV